MTDISMRDGRAADEPTGPGFGVPEVIGALRRRWLLGVAPVILGAPLAVVIALSLPATYVSTARLIVESQQIPDALARSTVDQSAAERIQLIRQRLFTRDNLIDIAERYRVFGRNSGMTPAAVVNVMQASMNIQSSALGRSSRRGSSVSAIDISFRARSPDLAARIANELVTQVLAQNVEDRTARAAGTVAFFEQEVQRLSADLDAQSTAIARFKGENQDALPSTLGARQGELNSLRDRIFQVETQRASLAASLETLRRAREAGAAVGGGDPVSQELTRLRSALIAQGATLAPSHPTMRQLQTRIAALEASLREDQQTTDGADAPPSQIEQQIAAMERDVARYDEQLVLLREQASGLEQSISRTPGVEMALAALERRYSSLQAQYNDTVVKRIQADTGERLEVNQQAERFEVVEQAVPPESPDSPNRPKIAAAGIAASGALGFGLMALAELLNRSMRTARDMERQLELRPLVQIPYVMTQRETRWRVWRLRVIVLGGALVAALGLFVVDQQYRPLPQLAEQVLDRTGAGRILDAVLRLLPL